MPDSPADVAFPGGHFNGPTIENEAILVIFDDSQLHDVRPTRHIVRILEREEHPICGICVGKSRDRKPVLTLASPSVLTQVKKSLTRLGWIWYRSEQEREFAGARIDVDRIGTRYLYGYTAPGERFRSIAVRTGMKFPIGLLLDRSPFSARSGMMKPRGT